MFFQRHSRKRIVFLNGTNSVTNSRNSESDWSQILIATDIMICIIIFMQNHY